MNKKTILLTFLILSVVIALMYASFFIGAIKGTLSTYKVVYERDKVIIEKVIDPQLLNKLEIDSGSDGYLFFSGTLTNKERQQLKVQIQNNFYKHRISNMVHLVNIEEKPVK